MDDCKQKSLLKDGVIHGHGALLSGLRQRKMWVVVKKLIKKNDKCKMTRPK